MAKSSASEDFLKRTDATIGKYGLDTRPDLPDRIEPVPYRDWTSGMGSFYESMRPMIYMRGGRKRGGRKRGRR